MLTRSELEDNPVVLAVADPDGQVQTVTAERVSGERVRITCSCPVSSTEGWCRHQLELLRLRYDDVVDASSELTYRFEDVVAGTPLADLADEIDVVRSEFERSLKALHRTEGPGLDPSGLHSVAHAATDLADAALHLASALERFKRRLAAGRAG